MPLNDHNNIELVPTPTKGTGTFVVVGTADKKLDRQGPVWSPHDIQ